MPETPLPLEEVERIAREYARSKWSGEVIAIHSNVVRRGKLHEVNGLVRVPYTEKGGQTYPSDSVFYGGYSEWNFTLWIRFDGEVTRAIKEQPNPLPDYITPISVRPLGPFPSDIDILGSKIRDTRGTIEQRKKQERHRLKKLFGL